MDSYTRGKIIMISVIVVIAAAVLFVPARLIYFRLYPGDRVKGTITVTVDGEEYSLDEKNITVEHEHQGYDFKPDDGEISLKAGDYGAYDIIISGLPDIPPITVAVYQANWWNVERFDLTVAVDTKEKSITYSGKHTYIAEDGFSQSEEISKKEDLSDKELGVGFGL